MGKKTKEVVLTKSQFTNLTGISFGLFSDRKLFCELTKEGISVLFTEPINFRNSVQDHLIFPLGIFTKLEKYINEKYE